MNLYGLVLLSCHVCPEKGFRHSSENTPRTILVPNFADWFTRTAAKYLSLLTVCLFSFFIPNHHRRVYAVHTQAAVHPVIEPCACIARRYLETPHGTRVDSAKRLQFTRGHLSLSSRFCHMMSTHRHVDMLRAEDRRDADRNEHTLAAFAARSSPRGSNPDPE